MTAERVHDKLGWLKEYRGSLEEWSAYQEMIDGALAFVRCRGLYLGAGFDLAAALRECGDLLLKHGGHAMAAGLSLLPDNIEALRSRRIRHAGLDVFHAEPLDPDNPLARMENVTLTAHAAFRTLEASMTLLRRAIDIVRDIVATA